MCSRFCLIMVSVVVLSGAALAEERITLSTRPEVMQSFLYQQSKNPVASVILFEGGPGEIDDSKRFPGFLQGSRRLFAGKGFSVATVEPPSDRGGDLRGRDAFRLSEEHLQDVEAIIRWLKKQAHVPVWLVGVSLGTQSVAWIGSSTREKLGGLVLASSKTRGRGRSVLEMELHKIRVPTLIVHHKEDACPGTPLSATKLILESLKNSPQADAKIFDGGYDEGNRPCIPGGPHTFNGIESEVVTVIYAFITANSK